MRTALKIILAAALVCAVIPAYAANTTSRANIAEAVTWAYDDAVKGCAPPTIAKCLDREARKAADSMNAIYKAGKTICNRSRSNSPRSARLRALGYNTKMQISSSSERSSLGPSPVGTLKSIKTAYCAASSNAASNFAISSGIKKEKPK